MNIIKASAVAVAASALVAVPVFASSPGQLASGQVLKVKNVTKNGSYSTSVGSLTCGDDLKYSLMLSNTEFGTLKNIVVKANLANGTATATPDSGSSAGTSGQVSVALADGQSLEYVSGSTVLFNNSGQVIKNLSDGVTAGGVNVGNLNGSTIEFVNFEAKVKCPVTPNTPNTPSTPQTPTAIPQTGGAEAGLAGMAGTGIVGYAALAYRRSRKAVTDALKK
jgi:hypothetical protein